MTELEKLVSRIDEMIRRKSWFDFHVLRFDGKKLIVAGGTDLMYYHSLEVIFEQVFFVSGIFQEWRSDTSSKVFFIPDNIVELNLRYGIEPEYQLFAFKLQEQSEYFLVAAKALSFNMDTVYYYQRENLRPNERIDNSFTSEL
jgi:hypothetical protein